MDLRILIFILLITVCRNSNAQELSKDSVCNEPAYVFVDEQATFRDGGPEVFRDWLNQNLVYNDSVKFYRITVTFIVSKQGNLECIELLRSGKSQFDNEVLKLLSTSPIWEPAKINGNPVNQRFVLVMLPPSAY